MLGPAAYASVVAILSLYFLLLVPSQLVLMVATRDTAAYVALDQLGRVRVLYRALTRFAGISSLMASALFIALAPVVAAFLRVPLWTVLALTPAIMLLLLTSVNRGVIQGQQRFLILSALVVLEAIAKTIVAISLMVLGFGAVGAILALGIGLAVSYVASFLPIFDLISGRSLQFESHDLFRSAVPVGASVLGVTLLYTIDVLLVKHFFDPERAGIYGSVSALGRVVFMASASITAVMFPRVTSLESRGASGYRTLLVSGGAMAIVAAGIVLAFALEPGIFLMPFGSQFGAAADYLPLFGTAMGLFAIANLLVNYLLAIGDHRFIPILTAAATAEALGIWAFHGSLWEVILCLLVAGLATVAALWFLCITRRRLA
jgi:O-antigen/teichoic acid export membrane protein